MDLRKRIILIGIKVKFENGLVVLFDFTRKSIGKEIPVKVKIRSIMTESLYPFEVVDALKSLKGKSSEPNN